jgi:STE24 endopeptidase
VTTVRAALLIAVLSVGAALVVGLVSRAPASVRSARPGDPATDPSRGATFGADEISRHGDYRGPQYLAFALGTAVQIATLAVIALGPFRRFVDAIGGLRGGWPVHTIVAVLGLVAVLTLVALPLAFVRGFAIGHAWDLSTQSVGSWISDQARSLAVSAVILSIGGVAFFGLVRWRPGSWWIWGWATFAVLSAVLTFLYPVVIAPLFYKFAPLGDEVLARDIEQLADRAEVDVEEVLVADASRRTTTENAYVAGLGSTRRVVVYDTLLESGGRDETLFVVAHELGHQRAGHMVKNALLQAAGLLVGFSLLALLARRPGAWSWAGASGVGDLKALPVLVLFTVAVGLLLLPVQNAVSRNFESEADRTAIDLTGDSDTAVRTFRRLAFSNLADLRPPPVAVWALYTHPPIPERIRNFLEESGARP